jgi:hypothetical protein
MVVKNDILGMLTAVYAPLAQLIPLKHCTLLFVSDDTEKNAVFGEALYAPPAILHAVAR